MQINQAQSVYEISDFRSRLSPIFGRLEKADELKNNSFPKILSVAQTRSQVPGLRMVV